MSDAPTSPTPPSATPRRSPTGPDRAGARAMLKAIGFTDEDLAKPIVGVGHDLDRDDALQLQPARLAEHVKAGIRAAGGTPMEFNTIAISDGVTMGTEGMKTSLVSREVVADSIELVVRGQMLDGVVCIVGLRQDRARRRRWRSAGSTCRASSSTAGRSIPGVYKGQRNATVVTVYEAIGAYRAGKITLDELNEIENAACPGPGACGGQYTANTMSTVMEFIGLSPAGLNGIPAEDPAKDDAARPDRRAGHGPRPARRPAVVDRDPRGARERDRQRGRDRRLDQRRPAPAGDRPRVRHPARHRRVRRDRRPDAAHRRHAAGRPLHRARHVRGRRRGAGHARAAQAARACSTATRRPSTAGRSPRSPPRSRRRPASRSSVPIETPLKPNGGLAILHGSLAPDGCVVKLAGHERRQHRGPARVFDSEAACYDAVRAQRIKPGDVVVIRYEGPVGGPGMQEMLQVTGGARRRGPGRLGRAADRRPVLGRHPRPDDRPRRARRPRSAARSRSSRRATRSSSTSTAARSTSTCRPDEVDRRFGALVAARGPLPDGRDGQVRGARRLRVARARSRPGRG